MKTKLLKILAFEPSPNLQRLSYADTVRGLHSDGLDGRSPVSKNLTVLTSAEPT
ncbi:hypothetical protein J6590_089410 [Homalodisca vitripennis]|nr:hypothetical protein J6590_089410 [Homalodisca vitripennis]